MRSFVRRSLACMVAFGLVAGAGDLAAAAGHETATDLFVGSVVSAQIQWTSPTSGTYAYTYTGSALGDLPGTFQYVEQGTVTLIPDPDGQIQEVGRQTASEIDLTPRGHDRYPIVIPNTDPAHSTYNVSTVPVSQLPPGALGALSALGGPSMVNGGNVTYGTWTFIDALGTFHGYSTPDFSKIAIVVGFDR